MSSLFLLVILINKLYSRVSQYYLSHDCSLLFKSSESLSHKSWLAAMSVVSRKVLVMLHSTFYEYSTLFLLCSSGKVIGSCQGEQGHQPLYSSLSKLLAVLHFSADPCQIFPFPQAPLLDSSLPDTVSCCPKAPLTVTLHCFQISRIAKSQILTVNRPLATKVGGAKCYYVMLSCHAGGVTVRYKLLVVIFNVILLLFSPTLFIEKIRKRKIILFLIFNKTRKY
jgi:hypothetical protein